jgi:hypothetical protein
VRFWFVVPLLKLTVLAERAQEPGEGIPEQARSTGPEKP